MAMSRLIFDPNISDTSLIIKGTWVTVDLVQRLHFAGNSSEDILIHIPEITEDDIKECLQYKTPEPVTVQYCPCGHVSTSRNPGHIIKNQERIDNGYLDALTLHTSECPECIAWNRRDQELSYLYYDE